MANVAYTLRGDDMRRALQRVKGCWGNVERVDERLGEIWYVVGLQAAHFFACLQGRDDAEALEGRLVATSTYFELVRVVEEQARAQDEYNQAVVDYEDMLNRELYGAEDGDSYGEEDACDAEEAPPYYEWMYDIEVVAVRKKRNTNKRPRRASNDDDAVL